MGIQWNPTKWIDDLVEKRMHAAGQAMVTIAKALVPVDTSLLQRSIYYTYSPDTKTLTLHADTGYAIFVEAGTHKMAARPYLRPALNAAGPAFLTGKFTGVSTQIMAGTYNNPNHQPLKIKPHIRPSISAANKTHNVGVTSRTKLTAVHMNRANESRRHNVGLNQTNKVMLSSLTKLNRIRKAWN
jgi:hypothetical protein